MNRKVSLRICGNGACDTHVESLGFVWLSSQWQWYQKKKKIYDKFMNRWHCLFLQKFQAINNGNFS